MENRDALERFSQAKGAEIEKLYWIAGSIENRDLMELFEELSDKDWKELFPKVYESQYFKGYRSDPLDALINFNIYGLIAQVLIPEASGFMFNESGGVQSWSSNRGTCRVAYAYGENLEELMQAIERKALSVFNEYVKKHKALNK